VIGIAGGRKNRTNSLRLYIDNKLNILICLFGIPLISQSALLIRYFRRGSKYSLLEESITSGENVF
jgi:hypothetical protein